MGSHQMFHGHRSTLQNPSRSQPLRIVLDHLIQTIPQIIRSPYQHSTNDWCPIRFEYYLFICKTATFALRLLGSAPSQSVWCFTESFPRSSHPQSGQCLFSLEFGLG